MTFLSRQHFFLACYCTFSQLFGDTVNLAARMESSCEHGKIQVSSETARILTEAGKAAWLTKRKEKVDLKGIGLAETYWLRIRPARKRVADSDLSMSSISSMDTDATGEDMDRLLDWVVDVVRPLLCQVIARRKQSSSSGSTELCGCVTILNENDTYLDQVKEIVALPEFEGLETNGELEEELNSTVEKQLFGFVASIADLYNNDNPFHNFQHACHVRLSTFSFPTVLTELVIAGDLECCQTLVSNCCP